MIRAPGQGHGRVKCSCGKPKVRSSSTPVTKGITVCRTYWKARAEPRRRRRIKVDDTPLRLWFSTARDHTPLRSWFSSDAQIIQNRVQLSILVRSDYRGVTPAAAIGELHRPRLGVALHRRD